MFHFEGKVGKSCAKTTWKTFVAPLLTTCFVAHLVGSTMAARPFFSSSRVLRQISEIPIEESRGEIYRSSPTVDDFEAIKQSIGLMCVQRQDTHLHSYSQFLLCEPRSGNPKEIPSITQQGTNSYPQLFNHRPTTFQQLRQQRYMHPAKPRYVLQSPQRPVPIAQSRMPVQYIIPAKRSTTYDFIRFGRSMPKSLTEKKEDKKASSTYDYIRFGKRSHV